MLSNEKTRPGGGAPERANGHRDSQLAMSVNQSTTTAPGGQRRIADHLSHGAANGLTGAQLEQLTGIDKRTIRDMVSRERIAGAPICADTVNGYYLGESAAEVKASAKSLFRRAHAVQMAAAGMLRACHDGQQMEINEEGNVV